MIPTFCMVPITIGGIVYGIVMGAITGYFSAAVGMLFVIAGIVGIISAAFPGRKALAVFYLIALVVVNFLGLVINVCGVADPQYLTTMEERDLGFIKLEPNVLWFLGGLLFMTLFCIPCITIAVVNVCTFRPRQPHEKVSRWKLSKVSYNDEEKKAGIPVVPSLQPFKESNDSENKKSSLTSSTNPSMKRRKKAETVKLGEVYSDSSAMSGHKETKKSSSSSSKTEKHLFGISKRPKKKAEDAEEPNKIVPLTSVVTSSTNGLKNTNENES